MPYFSIILPKFLLLIAYLYYFSGMISDIKTRKFKNQSLFPILIIGLAFAIITQGWLIIYSLIGFALITYVSLQIYDKNIIGAADLKVLSSSIFYINYFNLEELYTFLIVLACLVFFFTIYYLLKKNKFSKEMWKTHFNKEYYLLRELFYFKRFNDKVECSEESYSMTVPYTVPIGFSIIISTLILYFI